MPTDMERGDNQVTKIARLKMHMQDIAKTEQWIRNDASKSQNHFETNQSSNFLSAITVVHYLSIRTISRWS